MVEYEVHPVSEKKKEVKAKSSTLANYGKIFLWLGIGLAITGLLSMFLPDLLTGFTGTFTDTSMNVYIGLLIGAIVVMLPANIMISMPVFTRHKVVSIVGYFLYTLAMGVLMSMIMLLVAMSMESTTEFTRLTATAWLVTGGSFLLMGLMGILFKHMNALWPILTTLMLGSLVISLVNIFLGNEMIYWIVDFVIFGVVLLVTAIDMHNIHKIASRASFEDNTALAVYCAFVLYTDFISILIRVILYLLIFSNRNN